MEDRIKSVLARTFKSDTAKFSLHDDLINFGLNSINFIKFIILLEEEFDLEFYDSDIMINNFKSIHDIEKTLSKYFTN